jgi:spore maturation protein CgeB
MNLLYQGPLWYGSTSLQRFEAFAALDGVTAMPLDTGARPVASPNLYRRIRWKLRFPVDALGENDALARAVVMARPDAVVIDASRVIRRSTLQRVRAAGVRCLAYYTPDDIIATHNLSWPLRRSFPEWDLFFTTKTFNVPELAERGVRRPVLVGNAYDPKLHRPLSRPEVGSDFERFDFVFIGAYEHDRCQSINRLAEAGFRVVVYGKGAGWHREALNSSVVLRDTQMGEAYTIGLHHGKIALCFLRKLNRDRITTRTMEIAASGRPMLAEKTEEHDAHFVDGTEYIGFSTEDELIAKAKSLINDRARRTMLGVAARARCIASGYSTFERGKEMIENIKKVIEAHRGRSR